MATGAPGPTVLDLTDPATWVDPHAILGAARARHPLALTSTGEPVVLRYDDAEALLKDQRFESNNLDRLTRHGIVDGPVFEWFRRIMLNANGGRHARLRALVSRAFSPRSIERLRPEIRRVTHAVLDGLGDEPVDLVADIADQLPIQVMCGFVGVPADDYRVLAALSTEALLVLSEVVTPEQRVASDAAMAQLDEFVAALIEERRRDPRDDMVSALVLAELEGDRLDHDDLVAMIVNMIIGGHDTSASMLAIGLAVFGSHPEQQQALRADPGLAPQAAEEVIRFEAPTPWVTRVACADVGLLGVTVHAGDPVLVSVLAANRDPAVFEEPDSFDIRRPPERTLAFGYGPHFCLGASLARVEAQEIFATTLARREIVLLAEPEWIPYLSVRHLRALPARLVPA
jgi:cytochrome P450